MSFGDVTEKDILDAIETAKKEGKYTNTSEKGWGIDDFVKRVLIQLLSFRTMRESEDEKRILEEQKENTKKILTVKRMIDLHKIWRNSDPIDHAARAELVEIMEENADLIIERFRTALKNEEF